MKAVLFVGHGSRDPQGNDQVRLFIQSLVKELNTSIHYETCFLEFEQPDVVRGLRTCISKGATEIAVIPLMLFAAGHSKIHIPACIDEVRSEFPDVKIEYGKSLGVHDALIQACEERVRQAGFTKSEDTAVILLGRGGSDPDANSDLYKTARLLSERLEVVVEPSFMGVTTPLIADTVARTSKLGYQNVFILPYFLFTGILIKRLEKLNEGFNNEYDAMQSTLCNYLGFHDKLKEVVKERIAETFDGEAVMNCSLCQYRLEAAEHHHHHHHHDHDHDHHHDHAHEGEHV